DDFFKTRLELLLFDPTKDHDEYLKYLHTVRSEKNEAIYSPLYLLRNEIFELKCRKQWFPAMLLSHIAIDGIAKYFLDNKHGLFYKEFMGLTKVQSLAHRAYRNAREHNFGQLSNHLNRHWKELIFRNLIAKTPQDKIPEEEMKVIFRIAERDNPETAEISLVDSGKEKYFRVIFSLNAVNFLDDFDRGCTKLKGQIQIDGSMQEKLMDDLTEDNWMRVS
ncbi:MAG: hypothetical protein WCT27_05115, partial [Patescibacteria group bacterium]